MSNEVAVADPAVNALIPAEFLTPGKFETQGALSVVTKVGDYLPYISLCGSSSNLVKTGKVPMNNYAVTQGKTLTVLGPSFPALLLAWRAKAMRYTPQVVSYFDTNAEEFKKIQHESGFADSGCGYGPEYLLWLPDLGFFAGMFLGNISGRNAAGLINQYIGQKVIFGHEMAQNKKKQMWPVVVPSKCEYEIKLPIFDDSVREIVNKFKNPPSEGSLEAASSDSDRDR